MNTNEPFLISFNPKQWSNIIKFSKFFGKPFTKDAKIYSGVQISLSHIDKCENLINLTNSILPGLDIDEQEVQSNGYSSAKYSKMIAALYETIICELYSILDGLRITIHGIYKGIEKVQLGSVKKMFERAKNNEYGYNFPVEINDLLSNAYDSWYKELRKLRVEFTHGEVGGIHKDKDQINYFHRSRGPKGVIKSIDIKINKFLEEILDFLDDIYDYFYKELDVIEKEIVCGFYKGRCYQRIVKPENILTFDSGICMSKNWFEKNENFKCPMRKTCGAYTKV